MTLKKPGVIACDMFFPSKLQGWEKSNVLVMMDCYSRYVQAYNLEKKNETLVEIAMNKFFQSFLSLGQLPSVIICDKGTDLAPAKKVMEKFRNGRKGDLVLHSKTGQPVNIVEAMKLVKDKVPILTKIEVECDTLAQVKEALGAK